jgi:hypothetical protein
MSIQRVLWLTLTRERSVAAIFYNGSFRQVARMRSAHSVRSHATHGDVTQWL